MDYVALLTKVVNGLACCHHLCLSVHLSVHKLYLVQMITCQRFELEVAHLHQTCILVYSMLVLNIWVIIPPFHRRWNGGILDSPRCLSVSLSVRKPAYGVFTSQVIRYARIGSKKDDLLGRVKSLTKKLVWKHYTINGLKSSLKKCLKKHHWITTKLGPRLHQNLTEE